jgi:hypothetical protein
MFDAGVVFSLPAFRVLRVGDLESRFLPKGGFESAD